MGQDADAIRHDIELTRERMSERADALAYKADVPARTKDKVRETKDNLMSAVTGRAHDLKETVAGATPDKDEIAGQARRAKGLAETNPLGLALGAVALGFLAGLVVPATRLEHGKQVATDVAQAAKETAQESGQEHAAELKETAAETVGGSTSDDDAQTSVFDDTDVERSSYTQSWSDSPTAGRSNNI